MSADIIAGITLAALAIPEVMAYTKISGTPDDGVWSLPTAGLTYASAVLGAYVGFTASVTTILDLVLPSAGTWLVLEAFYMTRNNGTASHTYHYLTDSANVSRLAAPGYWLQILEGATTGWYYMMNNSRVLTVAGPDLTVRMRSPEIKRGRRRQQRPN